MPSVVRVRAPAKINLALGVGPLRDDGFHELATVYQALSLADEVEVLDRRDGRGLRIVVGGRESATVPSGRDNLAWKAAALAAQVFDRSPDLTITIDKGIPVAAGMAGGSADAAAVLRACGHLWDPDGYAESELLELAAELGSDVPFALLGGTAVGAGRGEVVTSAMGSGEFHWVLALSEGQLSTPAVYRTLDEMRDGRPVPAPRIPPAVLLAVRSGDAAALGEALTNDLQDAACRMMPVLEMLLDLGPEHGALGSLVSGSGPTCAFLVPDSDTALEMAVALSASGLCRAVRRASGPVAGATVIDAEG
ncbi:MAG: 4-(cytidine 5'-diphospho)-2-C-methyl-D-erythritol kinase [Candidatus Nanopelagicales bacterium]